MMGAARTSETSVDNYFTRQYIPEDNSELQNYNVLELKSAFVFRSEDSLTTLAQQRGFLPFEYLFYIKKEAEFYTFML
jgi:hypothetical protein